MTTRPNGAVLCDGCGADLGSAGIYNAVTLVYLDENAQQQTVHLGLQCGDAARVVNDKTLAWRHAAADIPPVRLYAPPEEDVATSPEPEG